MECERHVTGSRGRKRGCEAFAVEGHELHGVVGNERVLRARAECLPHPQDVGRVGDRLVVVDVLEDDPAALPGSRGNARVVRRVGRAHGDGLAFLDGLRTRVLHVAEQRIDLGRRPVRIGHVTIGRNAYRHEHRGNAHGDQQLGQREARLDSHRLPVVLYAHRTASHFQ